MTAIQQRKESTSNIYVDEEDVLGYKIWVAELELLVSQRKQGGVSGKVDFGACYALLQKLHVTIDDTSVDEIKEYQRRCEDALVDILLKGCPPPIRQLICSCLSKMYGKGDQLPLFSRVSSLQLFLGTREAFGSQTSEDVRLGGLELICALYYSHGRSLTVGVLETCLIACKYCSRSCSTSTRQAGLKLLAATVEGVGFQHREATQVQSTALKCIEKIMKEKNLHDDAVKLGISDVVRSISVVVPLESWSDGTLSLETVRNICMTGLKDPSSYMIRNAYNRALGDLVATIYRGSLCMSTGDEGKESKSIVSDAMESCLITPLAENLIAEDRNTSIALSQAWVHFLSGLKGSEGFDDAILLHLVKGPLVSLRVAGMTSSVERGPLGPDVGLGAPISTGERPFSQACVAFIVKCGIIEQMGDQGKKELLRSLGQALKNGLEEFPPSLSITYLDLIANIMETLGEIGSDIAGELEEVLGQCVTHPGAAVRWHAGSAIGILSITEPCRAATLLKFALGSLKDAADALVESSGQVSDKTRSIQGIPRWPGSVKFAKEIDRVHGWAVASAYLIASSRNLPLGIPSSYPKIASQLAAALIESPRSDHPGGIRIELEVGYIILGSLCEFAEDSIQSIYHDSLLNLWRPLISEGSLKSFVEILDRNDEQEISAELWWRSQALHALAVFLKQNSGQRQDQEEISCFLSSMVRILLNSSLLSNPTNAPSRGIYSQVQASAAVFQIRLLGVLLVSPFWDVETCHALIDICIQGMKTAGMSLLSVQGLQGFLTRVLDVEGWGMSEKFFSNDASERNLLFFSGASGALKDQFPRFQAIFSAQTYAQSLAESLMLAKAHVLARILKFENRDAADLTVQKLTDMVSSVKKDRTGVKRISLMLIAAAPFILETKIGGNYLCLGENSVALVENLASEILLHSSHGFWIQSTVSNLYFALSCLSSLGYSQQLLLGLCSKATGTPSLDQRITFILSIGSISRVIGGIGLTVMLHQVVETLHALARASPIAVFSSIAYSLTMISLSSGPGFSDFVEKTLEITQDIILNENIYSTCGLLPSIGRLGNAMVACLGPDYVLGSKSYNMCKSIVSEMRVLDINCIRFKEDILSGALQSVLYIQMLVLFAPRSSKTGNHILFLIETLPSGQPYLRRSAAETLRHLSEKETSTVLEHNIEGSLFAAYDVETDSITADQLSGCINVLIRQNAPVQPSRWITLLGSIATCSGISSGTEVGTSTLGQQTESFQQDDVHNMQDCRIQEQMRTCSFHPRLRTRLLAADYLNCIPKFTIRYCQQRCDAKYEAHSPVDWLTSCANVLVESGFKMVSGDVDILRSKGTILLLETLDALGDAEDPLLPDQMLMSQFQAQYVSALRASLSKDASPSLRVAGCSLVASFLKKGIIASDNALMEKMIGLLCEPLSLWSSGSPDLTQISYAEWVAASARVALLESHAICATLHEGADSYQDTDYLEIVARAQGPFYTILVECWTGLLEDTLVLVEHNEELSEKYTLRLFGRLGSSKSPTLAEVKRNVQKPVERSWPSILAAATFVLSKDRTVSHGELGKSRYMTLLNISIGFSSVCNGLDEAQKILSALERLTRPRHTSSSLFTAVMMQRIEIAARNLTSEYICEPTVCTIGAQIVQNLIECTSKATSVRTRLRWSMDWVGIASTSAGGLEKSLQTTRLAIANLISRSASYEDVCFCVYQAIKCGFMLSKNTTSAKALSLSYSHIVETAKGARASKLSTVSVMDPAVPSIEEILSFAASETCHRIRLKKNMDDEYILHTILVLGGMATYTQGNQILDNCSSETACQEKCLSYLYDMICSERQNLVLQVAERWLVETSVDPWVMSCGEIICPYAARKLYEYSTGGDHQNVRETILASIHIMKYFSAIDGGLGHVCMQSTLPILVRMAGSGQDKKIASSCMECLLGLAKATSSSRVFKNIISNLSEEDRGSLHVVLFPGGQPQSHSGNQTSTKNSKNCLANGMHSLDLTRFN